MKLRTVFRLLGMTLCLYAVAGCSRGTVLNPEVRDNLKEQQSAVTVGFSNSYVPSTWSQNNGGGALVSTSGAPASISFSDGGSNGTIWATFTNTAQQDGYVSFSYTYFIRSSVSQNPSYFLINNTPYQFTSSAYVGQNDSGQKVFKVKAGDTFGFSFGSQSKPLPFGPVPSAQLTLSNFLVIPSPDPDQGISGTLGFDGNFQPSQWTFTTQNPSGDSSLLDTSDAPASLIISNDEDSSGYGSVSQLDYIAQTSGAVVFSFIYDTENSWNWKPANCPVSYYVNGNYTPLPLYQANANSYSSSGRMAFMVNQGDHFGFILGNNGGSYNGCASTSSGTITLTLSDFSFTDLALAPQPPTATGFQGAFDPTNWTYDYKSNVPNYIPFNISTAPTSVSISSSNADSTRKTKAKMEIQAPQSGQVQVSYNYQGSEPPSSCPASYFVNGAISQFTAPSFPPGQSNLSGIITFDVYQGDTFGFVLGKGTNVENCSFPSGQDIQPVLTLSDFSFIEGPSNAVVGFSEEFRPETWKLLVNFPYTPQRAQQLYNTSNAPSSITLSTWSRWAISSIGIEHKAEVAGNVAFNYAYQYNGSNAANCPLYYYSTSGGQQVLVNSNSQPQTGQISFPVKAGDNFAISFGFCASGGSNVGTATISNFQFYPQS